MDTAVIYKQLDDCSSGNDCGAWCMALLRHWPGRTGRWIELPLR